MKRLTIACAAIVSGLLACSGCGQSPDELYTEAISLVQERDTLDEGLDALLTFERKYPGDPRTPEVLLSIATVHQAKNDYDAAVDAFGRLIDTYPGTPEEYKGRFLLGYLYYDDLGDTGHAAEVFNAFITAYPDSDLTASARVLLDNIDRPIEEWEIFEDIAESPGPSGSTPAGE